MLLRYGNQVCWQKACDFWTKYHVTGGKRCILRLRPFTEDGAFFILWERPCHANAQEVKYCFAIVLGAQSVQAPHE